MHDRPPDKQKPRPSVTSTGSRATKQRHGLATRRYCNARDAALLLLAGAVMGLVFAHCIINMSGQFWPPIDGLELLAMLSTGPARRRPSSSYDPVESVLSRLERVTEKGPGHWVASCPTAAHAHGDLSRGLSIREGDDGRILVHCFAGCAVDSIVSAIGLELQDLFPPNRTFDYPHHAPRGGLIGRPRFQRIPWPEVVELMEQRCWVCWLAFSDLARGKVFSPEELDSLAKLAYHQANELNSLRHPDKTRPVFKDAAAASKGVTQ